ncbi:MAG TPA: hypothetical protein VF575_04945 [Candidatus Saccharimonadales bacterium]|jgi:hypothetical protein
MAKISPVSSRSQPLHKSNSISLKRLVIVVFVILVTLAGLAAGWQAHREKAVAADKARFAQAEQDISRISQNIITTLGEPLRVDNSKFCSKPRMKYETGPLSCNVSQTIFYPANNPQDANTIMSNSSVLLDSKWTRVQSSIGGERKQFSTSDTVSNPMLNYQKIIQKYYNENVNIACDIVYGFYMASLPPDPAFAVKSNSDYSVVLNLSCNDKAEAEYYPLDS